jgi:signal peptidase II
MTGLDDGVTARGSRRGRALLLVLTLACAGCDQAAKHAAVGAFGGGRAVEVAGGVLRLEVVENTGGFLSLGAGLPSAVRFWILTAGVGVALALAALFAVRSEAIPRRGAAASIGLALFLGGGLGNWIDRVAARGSVVDFLQLRLGPLRTGIFNLADASIVVGAILVGAALMQTRRPEPPLSVR